jgi:hypothetical protein
MDEIAPPINAEFGSTTREFHETAQGRELRASMIRDSIARATFSRM